MYVCVFIACFLQTAIAILLARKAASRHNEKKVIVICMDNGGREGSGLLDHFKMNMPYKADVTYMSRRDAARRYGIVEAPNNIDNIQFIHTVLDSSFVDTHFIFDECPIYSKFNIKGRRVFSYDWSQLEIPESLTRTVSATVCLQPILYNKRDENLKNGRIQVTPPKSGQHIQLSRQYRSSKTVSKLTREIIAESNVQVIDISGSDGHDIVGPIMKSLVLEVHDETIGRLIGLYLEKEFRKLGVKPDEVRFLFNTPREIDLASSIVTHMSEFKQTLDTIGSFLGCESKAVVAISESSTDRVLEMLSRAKLIGYLIVLPSSEVKALVENLKTDTIELLKTLEIMKEIGYAELKQLLESGADVKVATKPNGWSLLHDAAQCKGNVQTVKLLLQHNADVNAK